MNADKLAKMQQQVRIGGKGTVRRKKKVVRRSSTTDDKKLQSSLKKLSVNNISGIEEVNMIKDDGSVIHFNNPKVQASLNANTFAISGHAENKQITEMLPGILNHLGSEGFNQLKRLASTVNANKFSSVTSTGIDEDDDVPELVEDFEAASKNETGIIVNGESRLHKDDDIPRLVDVGDVLNQGKLVDIDEIIKNENGSADEGEDVKHDQAKLSDSLNKSEFGTEAINKYSSTALNQDDTGSGMPVLSNNNKQELLATDKEKSEILFSAEHSTKNEKKSIPSNDLKKESVKSDVGAKKVESKKQDNKTKKEQEKCNTKSKIGEPQDSKPLSEHQKLDSPKKKTESKPKVDLPKQSIENLPESGKSAKVLDLKLQASKKQGKKNQNDQKQTLAEPLKQNVKPLDNQRKPETKPVDNKNQVKAKGNQKDARVNEEQKQDTKLQTDQKKQDTKAQTDQKKQDTKAQTDQKKQDTKAQADPKKPDTVAEAEQKKQDTKAKVNQKKQDTKVQADQTKPDTKVQADQKKPDTKAQADQKKQDTKSLVDQKKQDTKLQTDQKKQDTKAQTDQKKQDTKAQTDRKKQDTKAQTDQKKQDTKSQADQKKQDTKSQADQKKQDTKSQADQNKQDAEGLPEKRDAEGLAEKQHAEGLAEKQDAKELDKKKSGVKGIDEKKQGAKGIDEKKQGAIGLDKTKQKILGVKGNEAPKKQTADTHIDKIKPGSEGDNDQRVKDKENDNKKKQGTKSSDNQNLVDSKSINDPIKQNAAEPCSSKAPAEQIDLSKEGVKLKTEKQLTNAIPDVGVVEKGTIIAEGVKDSSINSKEKKLSSVESTLAVKESVPSIISTQDVPSSQIGSSEAKLKSIDVTACNTAIDVNLAHDTQKGQ